MTWATWIQYSILRRSSCWKSATLTRFVLSGMMIYSLILLIFLTRVLLTFCVQVARRWCIMYLYIWVCCRPLVSTSRSQHCWRPTLPARSADRQPIRTIRTLRLSEYGNTCANGASDHTLIMMIMSTRKRTGYQQQGLPLGPRFCLASRPVDHRICGVRGRHPSLHVHRYQVRIPGRDHRESLGGTKCNTTPQHNHDHESTTVQVVLASVL